MIAWRFAALGLLCAGALVTGCGEQPKTKIKAKTVAKGGDSHDHDHGQAPHGGTILEFGKYHGEFCVDHGKKQVTLYILDDAMKKAVPLAVDKLTLSIKTPQFQADLIASPQEGDPKGSASRFVATDDRFGKEQEFEGTVNGVIDGKPYLGDFKKEAHPGHDHGHGETKGGK